jgi:hypothetical protein
LDLCHYAGGSPARRCFGGDPFLRFAQHRADGQEKDRRDHGVPAREHIAAMRSFAHYNFVRIHRTLRVTPAMAAGVSDRLWSLEELVERASL